MKGLLAGKGGPFLPVKFVALSLQEQTRPALLGLLQPGKFPLQVRKQLKAVGP